MREQWAASESEDKVFDFFNNTHCIIYLLTVNIQPTHTETDSVQLDLISDNAQSPSSPNVCPCLKKLWCR